MGWVRIRILVSGVGGRLDDIARAVRVRRVRAVPGGVELDVLFVDEGFGTLDAESLEQAVATLHSLVQGRRMVGIISHVPELKSRIDRQIVVERTKNGSRIRSGGLEG